MTPSNDWEWDDQYCYECIPTAAPVPGNPTILYSLPPIGVGTCFVESISSYVARLAAAHSLPVSMLLRRVVAEHFPRVKHSLKKGIGSQLVIQKMCGLGKEASDFVTALEKLTGRRDLRQLTMLPFARLISGKDLLTENGSWCPHCLKEQRRSGNTVYYPLLWSLNGCTTCPLHKSNLLRVCPHCKAWLRPLTYKTIVGHCDRCNKWLGVGDRKTSRRGHVDFFVRLFEWHASTGHARKVQTFPALLNYLTVGERRKIYGQELKRKIHFQRYRIEDMCCGRMLPTLSMVFWVASHFRLDPFDVLTMSKAEMEQRDIKLIGDFDSSHLKPVQVNWQQLHGLLRDVASRKASAMRIEEIARAYKCSPEEIWERHEDLCVEISRRFVGTKDKGGAAAQDIKWSQR